MEGRKFSEYKKKSITKECSGVRGVTGMMMDGLSGKRDIKIDGCFLDLHEGPMRISKYLSPFLHSLDFLYL
jgi:hypothetical protein